MSAYYSASRSAVALALSVVSGWDVRGREHIPSEGGLVVASNHVSYWDPPMVGAAMNREVHYLAKKELFETPLVGPLIAAFNAIPIRRGMADLKGLARAIDLLRGGGALLVFPEGSRMRDGQLHPARPGVGLLAVNADAAILPCCITGSNRPGRWFFRRQRVRIWFGRARPWRDFAGADADAERGRALYHAVGNGVMRDIASLREGQLKEASRGAA